jgi:hypothetical protein
MSLAAPAAYGSAWRPRSCRGPLAEPIQGFNGLMVRQTRNVVGDQKLVDLRSAGLSNSASAGQRLRKKRQALVHPVIDAGMVVGELLVAMTNPKLI